MIQREEKRDRLIAKYAKNVNRLKTFYVPQPLIGKKLNSLKN